VTELTVTEPGPLTSTELDAVMDKRISTRAYTREQGEDTLEVTGWRWPS
jgi:hypothetical protein